MRDKHTLTYMSRAKEWGESSINGRRRNVTILSLAEEGETGGRERFVCERVAVKHIADQTPYGIFCFKIAVSSQKKSSWYSVIPTYKEIMVRDRPEIRDRICTFP